MLGGGMKARFVELPSSGDEELPLNEFHCMYVGPELIYRKREWSL